MITIAPYDPSWPAVFDAERDRIVRALGAIAVRIDHVGSTSVPGLAAKPVIDIQISVAGLHPLDRYRPQLEALGYVHRPHADDAFCPYFHRPATKPHSHHVHVVEAGGGEERRTLAFRDYLRAHPDAAREYDALKRDLAARTGSARAAGRDHEDEYAAEKGPFVERILSLAR